MKMARFRLFLLSALLLSTLLSSCRKDEDDEAASPIDPSNQDMYFPPNNSDEWESYTPESLNWNVTELDDLNRFLKDQNTKAFIVLVNGRLVLEEYYNGHKAEDTWQWNSAGKTLVTAITGIAQQEGYLKITDPASEHIGSAWTSSESEKEELIKIQHLLSMTSGLNEESQIVTPARLTYKADAGDRWAYSNVFQKLMDVVTESTGEEFRSYFNKGLADKIGMQGNWDYGLVFKIYHSDARSMARFGQLALNKGQWNNETIIDANFFEQSIQPSQGINPSYGYMWWLNGQSSFMLPDTQAVLQGSLVPEAPAEMYAAMGYADQRIYIVPSKNLVVVRMGEASILGDTNFALSNFDNEFWKKLNALIR